MANISEDIYNDIRSWRAFEAEKLGRPPFYIFSDVVIGNFLRQIDKIKCKQDILEKVEGIGSTLYEKYSDELWEILRPYLLKLGFIDQDSSVENKPVSEISKKPHQNPKEGEVNLVLFEELNKLRKRLAEERNLPTYCIFNNNSLMEMSRKLPTTDEAFLQISGVGSTRLKSYGRYFMEIIFKFSSDGIFTPPQINETEWSKSDLLCLKELLKTDRSLREIAQEMHRTEQCIRLKLLNLIEEVL